MTIKELAAELGKSKTHINNLINELGLKGELIRNGNRWDITEQTADKIRLAVAGKEPAADQVAEDIAFYKDQLQRKDEMIARLQAENMELVKTLQQHTYLLAQSTAPQQPIEAEPEIHAETKTEPNNAVHTESKGLFSRLFGR